MAYIQHTSWRDRPGAVAAVVAIHGLVGYVLVTGLTFTGIEQTVKRWQAKDYTEVPLPPPPEPTPTPEPTLEPSQSVTAPMVVVPIPKLDLSPQRPPIDSTPTMIPNLDFVPKVIPSATPGPVVTPKPTPRFSPEAARPRNNPASWVTEADYRSSWINREMIGTARFRLQLTAEGKVQTCTVTGSSGYPELDQATCDLVSRRARFDPAKDDTGAPVSGTYSSSVKWQLPE